VDGYRIHVLFQYRVQFKIIGDFPLILVQVRRDDLRRKAVGQQRFLQHFDIADVVVRFVPYAHIFDIQPVEFLGPLDELDQIVRHVLGIVFAVPYPSGGAPRQAVQDDLRIPFLGFLHQPPFVPAVVVFI
jgi:hypothetical protein